MKPLRTFPLLSARARLDLISFKEWISTAQLSLMFVLFTVQAKSLTVWIACCWALATCMWDRTAFGLFQHCESAGEESWHVTIGSSQASSATCAMNNLTVLVYVSSSSLKQKKNLPVSSPDHLKWVNQEDLAVLKNLDYRLCREKLAIIFLFLKLLLYKREDSEWELPVIHELHTKVLFRRHEDFQCLIPFSSDLCSVR